jgi:hypothetical protein
MLKKALCGPVVLSALAVLVALPGGEAKAAGGGGGGALTARVLGTIRSIDASTGRIQIGNFAYYGSPQIMQLSPATRIVKNNTNVTIFALQVGDVAQFTVDVRTGIVIKVQVGSSAG